VVTGGSPSVMDDAALVQGWLACPVWVEADGTPNTIKPIAISNGRFTDDLLTARVRAGVALPEATMVRQRSCTE
jgi:hypothetical protein